MISEFMIFKQEQHCMWHYTPDKGIYTGSHSLLGSSYHIYIHAHEKISCLKKAECHFDHESVGGNKH